MPATVSKKFEYTDDGLTFSGHTRATPPELELALCSTVTSNVPGRGGENHTKSWWEAQIRLYGLKCSKWTIDEMKKVLHNAVKEGIEISPEIDALEKDVEAKHAKAEEATGRSKAAPDSLERQNETKKSTSIPNNATPTDRGKLAVNTMETMAETSRARQLENMNRKHDKLVTSPGGAGSDVFGTWQLDCPEVIETWGHNAIYKNSDIIWKIHPPADQDAHLWCSVNHIVVEGVICMDWRNVQNPQSRKRCFIFRGRDAGEGDLLCDDDGNKGWVMFTSDHECHGEFEVLFIDKPWSFTGKKIDLKLSGKKPKALEQEFMELEREWEEEMMW
jgi:hypothetical protein